MFAWSPDSRSIALLRVFPGGEQIEIIDSATGETIRLLDGFIGGSIKTFRWSPDGTRIIGQSERGKDSRIHIWNVATGKLIQAVAGETFSLIDGGTAIAVYSRGQPFRIYDTITGRPKATFKGDLKDAYNIVFSPDSRRVASAHRDKTIRVWDVATGKLQLILTGHYFPTVEMLWKPNGTQLLTRGDDDTWKLWDVTLGTEI
ncbi:MAG: PD40 domain-containing protein [Anaerolineae bacterium]|nr:PD40 domain-containing protein [Anaerolineae bacterium]